MPDEEKDLIFPMHLDIDVNDFKKGWTDVEPKLQAILDKQPLKVKLNIDESAISRAISQLEKLNAAGGGVKPSTQAAMLVAQTRSQLLVENQSTNAKRTNAIATDKQRIATANAEKAELTLERAKQRGISAVYTQNKAYQAQRGILNGMPQFVNAYISVLGAFRLGQNIVDTTAEFEMQRVALAAIIQDKAKADKLFSQDIELGLQSPFQIKELITATKQLAAYRIETDQLFDTTKRLADISAGLGVPMERLILAYGQVRAAGILRGMELRQFTEAGIPMVSLLADKFTILNGKATTTADVFKLISERGVSFGMVKSVFEDITNAGGTFYNMQEVQSKTLKGSLSNLRDAMDKMFMQIGNVNMAPMKSMINGVKDLMSSWQTIADVGTNIVVIYGTAKLAILAYNTALGAENSELITTTLSSKRKSAAMLIQASSYRSLESWEVAQIATSKAITSAEWLQLYASGAVTKENMLRMVAMKRMSVQTALQIISTQGLTLAETRLAESEVLTAASTNRMKVAWISATASIRMFTVSVWASTKALLLNPYTWVLVGLMAVVKGYMAWSDWNKKYTKQAEESSKATRSYATEMTEAYSGIRDVIEKGSMTGADEKAITSARAALQQIIEKNEELKPLVDERLSKLTTEAKKLTEIKKIWEELKTATKDGNNFSADMIGANKSTGFSFLNDDVIKNAGDFKDKIADIQEKMGGMRRNFGLVTSDLSLNLKHWQEAFESGKVSVDDYKRGLIQLRKVAGERANAFKYDSAEGGAWEALARGFDSATRNLNRYEKDANIFFEKFERGVTEIGEGKKKQDLDWANNNKNLTKENYDLLIVTLIQSKNSWFNTLDEVGKKGISTFNNVFNRRYNLPIMLAGITFGESNFQKSYNAYIKKKGFTRIQEVAVDEESGIADTDTKTKEKLKKQREDNNERLDAVAKLLKNTKTKDAETIKEYKTEQKELLAAKLEVDDMWAQIFGETDKPTGGKTTDPRIAELSNQLKVIEEAKKKFEEISALKGEDYAKKEVTKQYQSQLKPISIAGVPELKDGLSFAFDQKGMDAAYSLAILGWSKLGKDAANESRSAFIKQADSNFDDIKETIKSELDKLASDIEQTQKANDFYEKMLGLTGSADTAKKLTESMGMTVGGVRAGIKDALSKSMKVEGGVDYTAGVDMSNIGEVQKQINKMKAEGLDVYATAAQKQLESLISYDQKQLEEIYSSLADYQVAADKKIKIDEETQEKIRKIKESTPIGLQQPLIDAANKKAESDKSTVDFEEFKKSAEWLKTFDDLSRMSKGTLNDLLAKLEAYKVSAKDLKVDEVNTLISKITEIRKESEKSDPFKTFTDGLNEYIKAAKAAKVAKDLLDKIKANPKSTPAEIGAAKATYDSKKDDQVAALVKMGSAMDGVAAKAKVFETALNSVADAATELLGDNEFSNTLKDFAKGFGLVATMAGVLGTVILAVGVAIEIGLGPIMIILAAIAIVAGTIFAIIGAKARAAEKEQERLAASIKDLDRAYKKLEQSAKKSLGADYVKAIHKQQEVLLAQQRAAIKQAEAEKSKGKKEDEEKTKDYYDQAAQYAQDAADKIEEIRSKMTGYSTVQDAASEFAKSWLDAYMSFSGTADAMKAKFKDMMNTMVADSMLAKMMAVQLQPVFDLIDKAVTKSSPGGEAITTEELQGIINEGNKKTVTIDANARVIMNGLGIKEGSGNPTTSLSGIAASVSSMDEATANTFGGYLNSGLIQWVQQTGLQTQILATMQAQDARKPLAEMYALQQASLNALNGIKGDTAKMVDRLTTMVDTQNASMISGGQKAINVRLLP